MPTASQDAQLGRAHARRLRDIHRSAGWPCQDVIEVELLAAGLIDRVAGDDNKAESLRLTQDGLIFLAHALAGNRQQRSAHQALALRVAREMQRAGRLVWTELALRARLTEPSAEDGTSAHRWRMCRPDVFSIRNTSVATYLEPIVHEVKVRRADLLGDLKSSDKRDSYLDVGGQCWYVLGLDAKGRPIAEPEEVPEPCGVLIAQPDRLVVARQAQARAAADLPFALWMALARSTPLSAADDMPAQAMLGDPGSAAATAPHE